MDPTFNSSFIPKRSLQGGVGGSKEQDKYTKRRSLYGPGFFVAVLLFVVSLVFAFGVFAYVQVKVKTIDQTIAKIEAVQADINPAEVKQWQRIALRLSEAQKVVQEHRALTGLFVELENSTLRNVQYTTFEYTDSSGSSKSKSRGKVASSEAFATVQLEGVTPDLYHVAQQVDQYQQALDTEGTEGNFLSTVVDTLTYNEDDGVLEFSVEIEPSKSLISFSRVLEENLYNTLPVVRPAVLEEARPVVSENNEIQIDEVGEGGL